MGELRKIHSGGDLEIEWNLDNEHEVEEAKRIFDESVASGYIAYKVMEWDDRMRRKGEMINEFDANAEKIVLIPPIAGG